jgi:iron(III) transport system substrate-binding protein
MKDWLPRILVLLALAIILGVPFLLRPGAPAKDVRPGDANTLIILTPHNDQTRYEFSRAFNQWRKSQGLAEVHFDWRASLGTSDLRRKVLSELRKAIETDGPDARLSYDLMFGGGDYNHNLLAKPIKAKYKGKEISLAASVPAKVSDQVFAEAFPQPTIGGEPLYFRDRRWVAVAMSSFGIVYNRDVLKMLELPEPRNWPDMADPRYQGWVALADPGHSGSISTTFSLILQRMGWTEGWSTLRRVFANARYFSSTASQVPVDVSNGQAAAGMCIDFYGRFQSGAIGGSSGEGGNRVGYIAPVKQVGDRLVAMTAVTADPVSVMRGAPHEALANQFVQWLLSKPAQQLWQARRGSQYGPEKYELRRLPARRDLYNKVDAADWVDLHERPFDIASPLPPGTPNYFSYIAPISHAMAIDIQDDLRDAWRAINRLPADDPRRTKMLALFDAMPEPLDLDRAWPDEQLQRNWQSILADKFHPRHAEARKVLTDFVGALKDRWSDRDRKIQDRLEWTRFFRANYRKIVAMGQ